MLNPTTVRLSERTRQALKDEAEAADRSVNWLICRLLDEALGLEAPRYTAALQAKQKTGRRPSQAPQSVF